MPKTWELPPEAARRQMRKDAPLVAPTSRPLARVEDRSVPGPAGSIAVRVYVPEARAQPLPMLVFLHGGGFVIGDLDTHDALCRRIADVSRCIVVAVDYRLAPEHRYPAAVDDAEAAFSFVRANAESFGGDPLRVGIGGDSAGGNLSAVVSRRLRDRGAPLPKAQLLVYPATDLTMSRPSIQTFARGFFLERATMDYFIGHYLASREQEARESDASPLFTEDLRGLPPAIVRTAGFDPLRDEGDELAARLRDAGVHVDHECHETLVHGFASMGGASRPSLAALDAMSRALGALLRS
jgi:acetyl esterase